MTDYLITIHGNQNDGDRSDSMTLSTIGDYFRRDGVDYIRYKETAATGFDGDITTLMIEDQARATISRKGSSNARLIIEKGQRHLCHYDTGYGNLNIGISADRIENELGADGGDLRLRYTLDVNANTLSVNELNINVREVPPHA